MKTTKNRTRKIQHVQDAQALHYIYDEYLMVMHVNTQHQLRLAALKGRATKVKSAPF